MIPFSFDILLTIDSCSKWESWEWTLHPGITSTVPGRPEGSPEGIKAERAALLSPLSLGVKGRVPFTPGASGFRLTWSLHNPLRVGAGGERGVEHDQLLGAPKGRQQKLWVSGMLQNSLNTYGSQASRGPGTPGWEGHHLLHLPLDTLAAVAAGFRLPLHMASLSPAHRCA